MTGKERQCREENGDCWEKKIVVQARRKATASWENKGMFKQDWLILTPNLICLCDICMITTL
jgi:hypothetical protein